MSKRKVEPSVGSKSERLKRLDKLIGELNGLNGRIGRLGYFILTLEEELEEQTKEGPSKGRLLDTTRHDDLLEALTAQESAMIEYKEALEFRIQNKLY